MPPPLHICLPSQNAYRSPDPLHLFPRVASGDLIAASLQTSAWTALEAAVARLTSESDGAKDVGAAQVFQEAWRLVLQQYAPLIQVGC